MNYFVFLHFKNIVFKGIQRITDSVVFLSLILVVVVVMVTQVCIKISIKDSNFLF